jgi:hypothetical protein
MPALLISLAPADMSSGERPKYRRNPSSAASAMARVSSMGMVGFH